MHEKPCLIPIVLLTLKELWPFSPLIKSGRIHKSIVGQTSKVNLTVSQPTILRAMQYTKKKAHADVDDFYANNESHFTLSRNCMRLSTFSLVLISFHYSVVHIHAKQDIK